MLENDKLTFFTRKLFSILDDKRKLELIKKNKYFQKILDINIMNYKRFSTKYIIYETKEKGKEYDSLTNELIFEGEYLNGKRSGKGKEYFNTGFSYDLIFEGEYSNGEKNGKGKDYYDFGQLKFIGEYLNGKEWNGKGYDINGNYLYELKDGKGFIKQYYRNGFLKYEGDYLNGKGKEYSQFGYINLIYEGEYLNGERHGKGKEYYSDKLIFEGEYKNGKRWNGKEYDQKNNKIYEIKEGKGFIKDYFIGCLLKFEGEYLNQEKNGKGKEYEIIGVVNNLIFEGEYLNGKRNGKGKEYYNNGNIKFEGEYLYNTRFIYGKRVLYQ